MGKTNSKNKRHEDEDTDIRTNPTPDAIKKELGNLRYLSWVFAIFVLLTIPLTVTGLFSYSLAGVVSLSALLLLIFSFKNKNVAVKLEKIFGSKENPNGQAATIVLVSIFILALLCMLVSGIVSGMIMVLEMFNNIKQSG
jgi:hypothetical protein